MARGLTVASQLAGMQTEFAELAAMSGKSRSLAQTMVARLETDRKNYQHTVANVSRRIRHGNAAGRRSP